MFDSPPSVPRTPPVASAVRRYRLVVVAVLAICVLASVAITVLLPARPVATAKLTLQDPRGNSVFRPTNLPPADLATYTTGRASFAHSGPVLTAAAATLADGKTEKYLSDHTASAVGAGSDIIKIDATGKTKVQSVAMANAVAAAYQKLSLADTQTAAATALKSIAESRTAAEQASATDPSGKTASGRSLSTTLANLDSSAATIRLNAALFADGVSYVQPADPSMVASSGNAVKNIVAGILIGLLFGVALAVAMASRRRPLEDAEDAHEILVAPMLGELTQTRHGVRPAQYDVIASALTAAMPRGVIAITDCRQASRSAGAAVNIVLALATNGTRIGLLDAGGSNRQSVARVLDVRVEPGMASTELQVAEGVIEVNVADPRRTSDALSVLSDMRSRCDLVVVLYPSVEELGASRILKASDSALVMVPAGELSSRLTRLRHVLALLDVPVLGYVFTRGRISSSATANKFSRTAAHRK